MNYQALARKWRPTQFDEVVGQQHVVDALTHALKTQRLHHAYLFTGTRGVGKTTLARIFAKCLNCEIGVTATPCGTCASCEEIAQGRFMDLIEVDAASRTKVEDTRELLDNVQYAPTRGRYKIYIIDEVHMLSGHSFNALLKTLEEPPEHVIFLLATTDPQKLPITVLSRCLQFHLKNMPVTAITTQVKSILGKEEISFEPEALSYIAQSANGSMRDALSILDQAIAHGQGQIQTAKVLAMLGSLDKQHTINLLTALQQNDSPALLQLCQHIAELAADYQQVLADLLHCLTEIAILQAVPDAELADETQRNALTQFAKNISKENIQLYYQIALIGNKDLTYAPSLQTGFTMIMLRMLSFTPSSEPTTKPLFKTSVPANTTSTKTAPQIQKPIATPTPPKKAEAFEPEVPNNIESESSTPSNFDWAQTLTELSLSGPLGILAKHCMVKTKTSDKIILVLDAQQAPLLTEKNKERLIEAITTYFKKKISIDIEVGKSNITNTPASIAKQTANQAREKAQESIKKDSNVQAILEQFNATINMSSVKTKEE